MRLFFRRLGKLFIICIAIPAHLYGAPLRAVQQAEQAARERERKAAREQFSQNFRELQQIANATLKAHDQHSLKASDLQKNVKGIQKRAKTLRGLTVLGEPVSPPENYARKIETSADFDRAIRTLAQLVYDFAHNPVHQNTKVFDTNRAARAIEDLINIINLAKIIEDNSDNYQMLPKPGQSS
jgi:hypothetical protein